MCYFSSECRLRQQATKNAEMPNTTNTPRSICSGVGGKVYIGNFMFVCLLFQIRAQKYTYFPKAYIENGTNMLQKTCKFIASLRNFIAFACNVHCKFP